MFKWFRKKKHKDDKVDMYDFFEKKNLYITSQQVSAGLKITLSGNNIHSLCTTVPYSNSENVFHRYARSISNMTLPVICGRPIRVPILYYKEIK